MNKKQTDTEGSKPPQASKPSHEVSGVVAGASPNKNGRIYDTGYIYAPFVPIHIAPMIDPSDFSLPRTCNSPLEDLVEKVYAEEIESGELKPLRKNRKSKLINPDYFSIVTVTDI